MLELAKRCSESELNAQQPRNYADGAVIYAIEALDRAKDPKEEVDALSLVEKTSSDENVSPEIRRDAEKIIENYRKVMHMNATLKKQEN